MFGGVATKLDDVLKRKKNVCQNKSETGRTI